MDEAGQGRDGVASWVQKYKPAYCVGSRPRA